MIYINGRFLSQPITGVQRYGREIIACLLELNTDMKILVPQGTNMQEFPEQTYEYIGVRQGHLWEQLDLFNYLKNKKSILLNLTNTAPIRYKFNIFTLHDVIFLSYPKSYKFSQWLFYKFTVPMHLKNAIQVLTVSEYSKNAILSKFRHVDKNKISITYNAVPKNLFNLEKENTYLNNDLKSFCVLSSFDENKNLSIVIDAFKLNSRADIELLILGSHANKHPEHLRDALRDRRVKFLGRISDAQLSEIYNKSYAFIIPSKLEGFGIPALEAQAQNCPVIASNTSCLPEILADSALFFDPNDANALSQTINHICDHPEIRNALLHKAKSNLLRFSFSQSAKKILNIIQDQDNAK